VSKERFFFEYLHFIIPCYFSHSLRSTIFMLYSGLSLPFVGDLYSCWHWVEIPDNYFQFNLNLCNSVFLFIRLFHFFQFIHERCCDHAIVQYICDVSLLRGESLLKLWGNCTNFPSSYIYIEMKSQKNNIDRARKKSWGWHSIKKYVVIY
jgi:hypothetical protein